MPQVEVIDDVVILRDQADFLDGVREFRYHGGVPVIRTDHVHIVEEHTGLDKIVLDTCQKIISQPFPRSPF